MKITELITKLEEILKEDGDMEVLIDSTNELSFGGIKSVSGKMYSYRLSNEGKYAYILSDIAHWIME